MKLIYRLVLEHLTDQTEDNKSQKELYRDFRTVMGSIVVLAESLSKSCLATLLKMSL